MIPRFVNIIPLDIIKIIKSYIITDEEQHIFNKKCILFKSHISWLEEYLTRHKNVENMIYMLLCAYYCDYLNFYETIKNVLKNKVFSIERMKKKPLLIKINDHNYDYNNLKIKQILDTYGIIFITNHKGVEMRFKFTLFRKSLYIFKLEKLSILYSLRMDD